MLIRSHDVVEGQVNAFLAQIQTRGEMISMLRSLDLRIQCGQRALVDVFHCMNGLEELTLSLQHPSDFGRRLFHALKAKRSPLVNSIAAQDYRHVDLFPCLTSLKLHYMRGHRSAADFETIPLVRAVAWSRKQASPLTELKVWAGNHNVVDYASIDYFREHLGMEACCHDLDKFVCTSTLTQELILSRYSWCCLTKLLDSKLESLAIFSRLKILEMHGNWSPPRIIFSDLNQLRQIEILRVSNVLFMPVPPDRRLPLLKTLRELYLEDSPTDWMSGYVFMNLTTFIIVSSVYDVGICFSAGQGQATFPCLCTIRLLHRRLDYSPRNWGQKKLDQLVCMIWGAAEVRKTDYEEDDFHVFRAEALSSVQEIFV
jgi:hypothetical protein